MKYNYWAFQQDRKQFEFDFTSENRIHDLRKFLEETDIKCWVIRPPWYQDENNKNKVILWLEPDNGDSWNYCTDIKLQHIKELDQIIGYVNTLDLAKKQDESEHRYSTVLTIDDTTIITSHWSTSIKWNNESGCFETKTFSLISN